MAPGLNRFEGRYVNGLGTRASLVPITWVNVKPPGCDRKRLRSASGQIAFTCVNWLPEPLDNRARGVQ